MPDPIKLNKKITEAGARLLQVWLNPALRFAYPNVQEGPVLGGYGATLAACGEPHEGDIDLYLPFPVKSYNHSRKANAALYLSTAKFVHSIFCAANSLNSQAVRWKTNGESFFQFEHNEIDYNIGQRQIYSNFQVSVSLQSYQLVFDPSISTHAEDFNRYKHYHEIISYNFESLVQRAENDLGTQGDVKVGLNTLAWVLKSYVKPFKQWEAFLK